jgi:hypothetical protein
VTVAQSSADACSVLIVGGGVAGLAAALALRELDGERIGEAPEFAIKHGGIAAQQAEVPAHAIAALVGLGPELPLFHLIIHGIMLADGRPRYLSAHVTTSHGSSSQIAEAPIWSPAGKIAAKYLAPYVEKRDRFARTNA